MLNSVKEKYYEQKSEGEKFEKAIEEEKKLEEEFNKLTIETQKAKKVFEKARQVRNDIQEKMRLAFLSCAQEFQAPGYLFSLNSFQFLLEKPVQQLPECNICFEEFNSEERKESVLHCGHRSCYKCLTEVPNKLCPICRKEYTTEQIIKFF